MLAEARRKAAERGVAIRLEEGDAERLPFPPGSFDLAISRHLLWTLPHPEAAIDEWIRVLRPGGRLVVVDGQFDPGAAPPSTENARMSQEYAAVGDQLPFLGGRSREEIETLLKAHGLVNVGTDPLLDLVAAQEQRMGRGGAGAEYAPTLHRLGRRRALNHPRTEALPQTFLIRLGSPRSSHRGVQASAPRASLARHSAYADCMEER